MNIKAALGRLGTRAGDAIDTAIAGPRPPAFEPPDLTMGPGAERGCKHAAQLQLVTARGESAFRRGAGVTSMQAHLIEAGEIAAECRRTCE